MSARLPNQLHDLASEMPVDVDRTGRATLQRARRRRGASALLAVAAVTAIVAGGVAGVRLLSPAETNGRVATPSDRPSPPTPTVGATPQPSIGGVDVPAAVAETYTSILEAAPAHDIDALRTLLDPNTFVYDFDDGSDPTPLWREDPSVLDTIPGILELPFVVRNIEGYGTFYQWPYLVDDGALDDVSAQEREDLHALGFSDAEIEQMREYGGYLGPRLSIDADGLWRNYVTGGD